MEIIVSGVVKKRRTNGRRPQIDAQKLLKYFDVSQTLAEAFTEKQFQEGGNYDDINNRRIVFALHGNNGDFGVSKTTKSNDRPMGESTRNYENGEHRRRPDLKRCSEDVALRNREVTGKVKELSQIFPNGGILRESCNGSAENKLRKVKLKVGGLTRTILTKSNTEVASDSGAPSSSAAARPQRRILPQDNSDYDHFLLEKSKCNEKLNGKKARKIQTLPATESTRKSKRVRKSRLSDSSDEEEEAEIHYLERLKRHKINVNHGLVHKNDSMVCGIQASSNDEYKDSALAREARNGKGKSSSDGDSYGAEEELSGSYIDPDSKQKYVGLDSTDGEKEIILTRRQRALRFKDGSGGNGTSLAEFSDGLPLTVPRKQKDKLSEVEQQLKKAEAAERRKIQVEKKAMDDQAEAIRKILGQESGRKKRENLMQKKRDELAQKRAEASLNLAPNMVRFVSGPNGITLTFPECVDLQNIFNSKPCSYPPPREKCAGPSCTNAYKYRDSKSNLPLCSLECYRAVQEICSN